MRAVHFGGFLGDVLTAKFGLMQGRRILSSSEERQEGWQGKRWATFKARAATSLLLCSDPRSIQCVASPPCPRSYFFSLVRYYLKALWVGGLECRNQSGPGQGFSVIRVSWKSYRSTLDWSAWVWKSEAEQGNVYGDLGFMEILWKHIELAFLSDKIKSKL